MSDSDLIQFRPEMLRLSGDVRRVEWWRDGVVKGGDTINAGHISRSKAVPAHAVTDEQYADEMQWLYEVRGTFASGWTTDHLGASNHARLGEDYGEYLVCVSWVDGDGLAVLVGSQVPQALVNALEGLEDYPVYDETDLSKREWAGLEETLDLAIHDALNTADVRLWSEHEQDDLTDAERETVAEYVREQVREDGQWCREEEVSWPVVQRWALEQVTGLRNVPFA